MHSDQQKLQPDFQRLLNPQAFAHPVEQPTMLETHISWVILTGDYAYKIKKQVNFGFVDYESLERRQHFCELEVELNRRFAPDLYLGVVPIFEESGSMKVGDENWRPTDSDNAPIEYAVKMRQFPQDAILASRLHDPQLTATKAGAFGRYVAEFHDSIESAIPTMNYGHPDHVVQDALDNFATLDEYFGGDRRIESINKLQDWTSEQAKRLLPKFQNRLELGKVRRCHGDLHLKNIIQNEDRLMAFDGIEFSEQLQWIDVLSEISFPVMDFIARGRADLAWRFLNSYVEETGDYQDFDVLRFYLVYRALVRAKVTRLNPKNDDPEERRKYATGDEAYDLHAGPWDKYFKTATYFAFEMRPALAITYGLSGSGKSTMALKIIEKEGGIRIRSDVERLQLAKKFNTRDKYSSAMSDQVYSNVLELARKIMLSGFRVIVDATFLKQRRRQPFQDAAEALGIEFEIINCEAPYDELCRRIQIRGDDPSEATVEVLQMQMKLHDPLTTNELQFVRSLPTG